jgi:carbonic anhydrase
MGNVIEENDINFKFALKYAIENYRIKHFLIIGHFHCNSFKEAIYPKKGGLNNKWLKNIRQIAEDNRYELYEPKRDSEKYERNFCEVNIKEQIKRMGEMDIIQDYMEEGNIIYIYGLMLNGVNEEIKEIITVHS